MNDRKIKSNALHKIRNTIEIMAKSGIKQDISEYLHNQRLRILEDERLDEVYFTKLNAKIEMIMFLYNRECLKHRKKD